MLARREIDIKTLIAEVDFLLMCSFQFSFLSNQIPSQRWMSEGVIMVPFGSVTQVSSEVSGFRELVYCMSSDLGSPKATALVFPQLKQVVTASSSFLAFAAADVPCIRRQMSSI